MTDFFTPMKDKDGCGCGDTIANQNDKKDCGEDCDCHDDNTGDSGCGC